MPLPRLPAGMVLPKRVDKDALTVRIKPDGKATYVLDLSEWPGSEQMRREALVAIEKRTRDSHDGWRRRDTIYQALRSIRAFIGWCDQRGLESFADLTVEQFDAFEQEDRERYSVHTLLSRWRAVRLFLRDTGVLDTRVLWRVRSRLRLDEPSASNKVYLTLPEFFAVEKECMRIVSKARLRTQRAYEDLLEAQQASEPTPRQHALMKVWGGDYAREAGGSGSVSRERLRHLGRPAPVTGSAYYDNWFALTADEAAAAGMLLACRTGWNKSVIEEVRTGSWHSLDDLDQVVEVGTDKPRRRRLRHASEPLVDYGSSSAGRAFAHICDATAPARAWAADQGKPTDRLLLRAVPNDAGDDHDRWVARLRTGLPSGGALDAFVRRVSGDEKATFPVLRRTRLALLEKGAVHNSQRVWEVTYAGASPEVQADLDEVIAAGLQAQIDRAEEAVSMLLLSEDEAGADIANGALDTATGACRDITHNPVTGERCRESFLSCLGCTNAVATPRHLPRLVALHKALEDLRADSRDAEWSRWHKDWLRLSAFLDRVAGLTPEAYERYRLTASPADLSLVRAVLNGDLDV